MMWILVKVFLILFGYVEYIRVDVKENVYVKCKNEWIEGYKFI